MRNKIPDLLLEQWRLGELSEPRKEALRQEFGELVIHKALKQLEAEEASFIPPPRVRSRSSRRTVTPWLAAAGLVLAVFAGMRLQTTSVEPDTILLKGDAAPLVAFRQSNDKVKKVSENEILKEGDVIQFTFDPGSFAYGAIVSLDGRGHLTWLYPEDRNADGRLVAGQRTLLKSSYKLDDAPSFERFYLIRSGQVIDRTRLEQALQKQQLENPTWDVFSLSIRK